MSVQIAELFRKVLADTKLSPNRDRKKLSDTQPGESERRERRTGLQFRSVKTRTRAALVFASTIVSVCDATAADAQDLTGRWYGAIEAYGTGESARRILEIVVKNGQAVCFFAAVGVTVRPVPCSIENGTVELVTVANNPLRLVSEGQVLRGTIAFTKRNEIHPIAMGREASAVAPAIRDASQSSSLARALGPRDFESVPEPGLLPAPGMPPAQVEADCRRYFENTSYTGSLAIEKKSDKTQTHFWPGVYFAKFTTAGSVAQNRYHKRPVCGVNYSWSNKLSAGKGYLSAHFDGKWLMGRDYVMEVSGQSLLFTGYLGNGRRSWGTYERD